MKRSLLFITLLLAAACAYAQADSIYVWNKWCSRKDTLLLFNGANNVIQVYSKTLKPTDYKLKSLDKSLRIGDPEVKGDTLSMLAMPYPTKGKKMRLAILNSKTNKVIKILEFASDSVPKPVVQLGNVKGKEAAKKIMVAQIAMKVVFPNSLYSYPYQIRQYTFKITTPKGSATLNIGGYLVSKEIIEQISAAPEGTVAQFTGIKATCPECAIRTLDDLKITIR